MRWSVLRNAYPEHPAPWIQGAVAHIEAGELKVAESLLVHARQYFPNNPNSLTESARLAMRRLEWNTAEAFLRQAREKHPDNLQIWMRPAECAASQGDMKQAAVYFQKACECAPDRPGPFIQYAEMHMRAKQWEQALKHWEVLRTHFPDIPAGYLRAAEAARQLNRPKEARQLILAQQYGADIINNDTTIQNTSRQQVCNRSLGRFLELIWTKTIFNLRSEVHRNYLSYGWWVLEPLLHMVVYYLVFGLLLQRGSEDKSAARPAEIERFFAEPVAREAEFLLLPVPQAQREHARSAFDRFSQPPGRYCGQEHLRVGMPSPLRRIPLFLEQRTKLAEIVDLAIEGEHIAPACGMHRLVPRRAQIDDREAAMSECHCAVIAEPLPGIIGAALAERVGHRRRHRRVDCPERNEADYAAHDGYGSKGDCSKCATDWAEKLRTLPADAFAAPFHSRTARPMLYIAG